MHLLAFTLLLWLGGFQPAQNPGAPGGHKPGFTAKLVAAVESVAPGGSTELAVVLEVEKGWHIYHPIMLDTGLPTTLKFSGPAGVTLGEIQFPTPHLDNLGGLEYLALSGTVICTVPIKIADSFKPGDNLDLRVDANALECIENCVKVDASAKLSLPVSATNGKPSNAEIFADARKAFPPSLAEITRITGSLIETPAGPLKIHDQGELVAKIKVGSGLHIQDRDPGVQGLVGSRFYIEKIDGLNFEPPEKQKWPDPTSKLVEGFGKVRELRGDLEIRLPYEVGDEKFPTGSFTLHVLFEFQACNDSGTCFPPQMAEARLTLNAETPNPPRAPDRYRVASGAEIQAADGGQQRAAAPGSQPITPAASKDSPTLWVALVTAFLGGLILNIMPCVLPVISLKVLSFVKQAGEHPGRVFRLGLAFSLGILAWFWTMAYLATLANNSNFQLQDVRVVIAVASVLFLMALSLFGVFEFTLPGATSGSLETIAAREGYTGAFLKGLLATLLGTACTAPFLGPALAFAITQPKAVAFTVFTAAGFGMAAPYLLLSANPKWLRFVPKPGKWMLTFKQGMGFLLIGTAVWLLWVLGSEAGSNGIVVTLLFWTFLSFAAWMWGLVKPNWSTGGKLVQVVVALALLAVGSHVSFRKFWAPNPVRPVPLSALEAIRKVGASDWADGIPWVPYKKGLAEELALAGYTVYVDYTATWCATCQTNKLSSLEIESTRTLMRSLGVIPIEADFTNSDADMSADIQRFGEPSVPVNVIYPAGQSTAIKLPNLLTPSAVHDALRTAGKSKNSSAQLAAGTGERVD